MELCLCPSLLFHGAVQHASDARGPRRGGQPASGSPQAERPLGAARLPSQPANAVAILPTQPPALPLLQALQGRDADASLRRRLEAGANLALQVFQGRCRRPSLKDACWGVLLNTYSLPEEPANSPYLTISTPKYTGYRTDCVVPKIKQNRKRWLARRTGWSSRICSQATLPQPTHPPTHPTPPPLLQKQFVGFSLGSCPSTTSRLQKPRQDWLASSCRSHLVEQDDATCKMQ